MNNGHCYLGEYNDERKGVVGEKGRTSAQGGMFSVWP